MDNLTSTFEKPKGDALDNAMDEEKKKKKKALEFYRAIDALDKHIPDVSTGLEKSLEKAFKNDDSSKQEDGYNGASSGHTGWLRFKGRHQERRQGR